MCVRGQSGHYETAIEFGERTIALEKDHLGNRPERLVDIYFAQAMIMDEVVVHTFLWQQIFSIVLLC